MMEKEKKQADGVTVPDEDRRRRTHKAERQAAMRRNKHKKEHLACIRHEKEERERIKANQSCKNKAKEDKPQTEQPSSGNKATRGRDKDVCGEKE